MPLGLNSLELLRYFRQPENAFGKSIQRDWGFYGMFIYNPFMGMGVGRGIEFPPIIQPFHILSVTVPTYTFKKETMMYGQVPRSFPVLEAKALDLKISLEEDEKGTVDYFINWNMRNIIDRDGYYNPPDKVKLKAFVLEVQDKNAIPVVYYMFHDIFFMDASEPTYSYTSNDSIKRELTFNCDRMSTIYVKQNSVAAGIGAVMGVAGGIKNAKDDKLTGRFK
jgi:hypothetical protein